MSSDAIIAFAGIIIGSGVTLLSNTIQASHAHNAERRQRIRIQLEILSNYTEIVNDWFLTLQRPEWDPVSPETKAFGRDRAAHAWEDARAALGSLNLEPDDSAKAVTSAAHDFQTAVAVVSIRERLGLTEDLAQQIAAASTRGNALRVLLAEYWRDLEIPAWKRSLLSTRGRLRALRRRRNGDNRR